MPEPQQAQQAQQEWYKTQGSDGQWYTTQASSPEEATKKFASVKAPKTQVGVGPQTKPAASQKFLDKPPANQLPKYYGFTPANVYKNAKEGVKQTVKGTYEMGKDALSNPNWLMSQPAGQRPSTAQKFIYDPADAQMREAHEAYKADRLFEAMGHATAAVIPILGPVAANLGKQAGTGDIGGATGQAVGMVATGAAINAVGEGVKSFTNITRNRAAIADLNQKALKMAEGGVQDPAAYAAIRVAKENIKGNIQKVHADITKRILEKEPLKQQAIQDSAAKGAKLDPNTGAAVMQIVDILKQEKARAGTLNPDQVAQVDAFLKQLLMKVDPKTGLSTQPRAWVQGLPVQDAFDLTRTKGLLSKEAEFDNTRPDIVNVAARRIRGLVTDELNKVAPKAMRLATEQSELVKAREAADELVKSDRKGTLTTFRGIMNSGAPMLAAWIAAREIGIGSAVALGGALIFKRLAEAPLSRTYRAAFRARLLKYQEAAEASIGTPQPPAAGQQMPGGPPVPPPRATPPTAPLTPQLAAPNAQPVTTAAPLRPMPTPTPTENLGLNDKPAEDFGNKVKTKTERKQEPLARTTNLAESNTPQAKAMKDRLDVLQKRRDAPKSGADRNAIEREIGEIISILKSEDTGTKHAGAPKRIADRERLAAKRAEASASAGPGQASASGEAIASGASPEIRAIALDAGYKALAKFEGGDRMVTDLKEAARVATKLGQPYDEVERLTEVITLLKSIPPEK